MFNACLFLWLFFIEYIIINNVYIFLITNYVGATTDCYMHKIFRFISLCLSFCSLFSLSAEEFKAAQTCNLEGIDMTINEVLERFNVPGMGVGVIVDNKIVFARGYGFRDLNKKSPINEETLFPIASCTKAFTAFMMGQLVDKGIVSWDEPVVNYLSGFRLYDQKLTSEVTIRDLLAHRTNIPRNDFLWICAGISKADVLKILPHLEPACQLREKYLYSNFMYTVAGLVIEEVTGQSWEKALAERIFSPLGMSLSSTSLEVLQERSNYALPYSEIDGDLKTFPFRDPSCVLPGGGINSSVIDMLKWIQLLLSDNPLVQEETLREMHSLQISLPAQNDPDKQPRMEGYGLGWMTGNYRGNTFITHGGALDGFSSEVSLLPQRKIGLVFLTNSGNAGRNAIDCVRNILIDEILGYQGDDWMAKALENYNKEKQSFLPTLVEGPREDSTHSLQDFVGCYSHPAYGNVEVSLENEKLLAVYGQCRFPLVHKNKDVFQTQFDVLKVFGVNPYADVTFLNDHEGNISEMLIPFEAFRGTKPVVFKRIN